MIDLKSNFLELSTFLTIFVLFFFRVRENDVTISACPHMTRTSCEGELTSKEAVQIAFGQYTVLSVRVYIFWIYNDSKLS